MGYSIEKVGARLRGLRAEKHVSQQEVADATGVALASIHIYENNRGGMQLYTACKLADYYGIDLDSLVGRDSPAKEL